MRYHDVLPDMRIVDQARKAAADDERCDVVIRGQRCPVAATHRATSRAFMVGCWLCDGHAEWMKAQIAATSADEGESHKSLHDRGRNGSAE